LLERFALAGFRLSEAVEAIEGTRFAVLDLTHLHQLSRVMAHQYRDAVGPWSVYLGVLQCAGHSA
jgi:hypothetical protein